MSPTSQGPPAEAAVTTERPHVSRRDYLAAREAIEALQGVGRLVTKALITIGLGTLTFTAVNVTLFAVHHDVTRLIAWMLDPMVSVALLVVLYVDGVLAEHQYRSAKWPLFLRWYSGLGTWIMNCWGSLYPDGSFSFVPHHPDAAGVLLHSIAPGLLIGLSEAGAGYRKFVAQRTSELNQLVRHFESAEQEHRDAQARIREQERRAAEKSREAERRRAAELKEQQEERERQAQIAREAAERDHLAKLKQAEAAAEGQKAAAAASIERARIAAAQETARLAHESQERDREAEREAELIRARAKAKVIEEDARFKREEQERQHPPQDDRRAARAAGVPVKQERKAARGQGSASDGPGRARTQDDETMSQAERDARVQEATRLAARAQVADRKLTAKQLGDRYGMSETWGGNCIRAAKRQLAEDSKFRDEIETEELRAMEQADAPTDDLVGAP